MDSVENGIGKSQRVWRSAEEWREIFVDFEASGQTRDQFCAQRALKLSTFSRWRKRLCGATRTQATTTQSAMFVELESQMTPSSVMPWDVELALGDGMVLRLRRGPC